MQSVLSAQHFHDEAAAIAYVEARLWPHGPSCPHCGIIGQAGRLKGKTSRPGMWKCYACRKPFTVRMGTVFESSHVPLRVWLQAFYLLSSSKKGFSARQLQRTMGCQLKTAWFLGHRVREAMKEGRPMFDEPMGGSGATVEADETYIGRKSTTRAYKPPGEKQAVMALVQRGGKVRTFHVPNVTGNNLHPIIGRHVYRDTRFMSDESKLYTEIGWNFASHGTVAHRQNEYVRGDIHTNTVEGYFSILKRGIIGIYHHVSEAHLHRYLVEFDFRYSHRVKLGIDDLTRADLALKGAAGRRLTYRTTRGRRAAQPSA